MKTDKFVFFWDGPFSQWHRSKITLYGVEYNCAEQFMMAMKAKLFGDIDTYHEIMSTSNPGEQKALGRKVRGFDVEKWSKVSRKIVYQANYVKFTSNETLKKILLDTGDREIVEASPYDKIWGIGMGVDHADILDKTKWKGLNWLGEVLMQVREDIRKENL